MTTLQDCIKASVQEWKDKGYDQISKTDCDGHFLTEAEQFVFGIRQHTYAAAMAALEAFETYTDYCRAVKYPEYVWEVVGREHPEIPRDGEDVKAFAEFALIYVGVDPADAYKVFFKREAWVLRMGYLYYIRTNHDPRKIRAGEAP